MNNPPSGSGAGRTRAFGRGRKGKEGPITGGRGQQTPQLGAQTPAPAAQAWGQSGVSRGTVQIPQQAVGPAGRGGVVPLDEGVQQKPTGGVMKVESESTRGSVRGKTVFYDIVCSRPPGLECKAGKSGKQINVLTNYFRVLKTPDWVIYQYRVDFSPEVDNVRFRHALLAQHKQKLGGYIFDGTLLFCTKMFISNKSAEGEIELMSKSRDDEVYQVKLKKVGAVEIADSVQFQVLNLILRRAMEGLKLQLISRNFYDPVAKISLDSYHLEIWPGYQTSIRQHERGVLLSTEIAHKVMRTDTLYQIMSQCIRESRDHQTAFKQEVVGMIVLTDYTNKTYRIDDVDYSSSPLSKFSTKEGEITYVEYYRKRYNLNIRDVKQPLLVSRPTEKNVRGGVDCPILLVPELARATGMSDAMRANFRLMKAMGEHTRLNPDRRIERLRTFNRRLQNAAESMEVLKSWNLVLDKELVEVPGRVLPAEKIVFGNDRRYLCDDRADWTNEFRKAAMFSSVQLKRWYVITPGRSIRDVQNFVQMCIKVAGNMSMRISEPRYLEMADDRNGTYASSIEMAASKDPQMVMVVLANNNEEKYSCIKKKCCVDRALPSQVVTLRVIAPRAEKSAGLMSVATKVAIQMNAKLTGAPWMVELPIRGLMTVGFDVSHSSKDRNKSYGALVATMDMKVSSRFFSSVTEHMKGQELSNEMALNMTLALKAYRDEHGALPERVLFYRDGVGDGQLHQVYENEVQKLKAKMDEIYKTAGRADGCRFAFIVVSKRINTRYFYQNRNPVPGTIVDDVITLPERYDFFLVSQSVRQGTVSPTSYNVLYDTMGLDADKIQILTYKMTHMYYNYSGTCRVPAVCQYAHKLSFLIAESIHRAPASGLENQLYFL